MVSWPVGWKWPECACHWLVWPAPCDLRHDVSYFFACAGSTDKCGQPHLSFLTSPVDAATKTRGRQLGICRDWHSQEVIAFEVACKVSRHLSGRHPQFNLFSPLAFRTKLSPVHGDKNGSCLSCWQVHWQLGLMIDEAGNWCLLSSIAKENNRPRMTTRLNNRSVYLRRCTSQAEIARPSRKSPHRRRLCRLHQAPCLVNRDCTIRSLFDEALWRG